jgi:hypothetical protein
MISYRDKTFCTANECLNFNNCPDAFTPGIEFLASEQFLPVAFYAKPQALGCFKSPNQQQGLILGKWKQPKSKQSAIKLYGDRFDPEHCIRTIKSEGRQKGAIWQCGNRNGKGHRGLYCTKHAACA